MAVAGHTTSVLVSSDDSTYTSALDGINDISFGPNRDLLETTDFKDTTGAKTRMAGLKDGSIQLSGDYESADSGQSLIQTQEGNGGALYVKILWNGTAGHKVLGIVESYSLKSSVGDKVTWEATVQFNGAPSAV